MTNFQAVYVVHGSWPALHPPWVTLQWVPGPTGRAASSADSLGDGQGILWVSHNLRWLQVTRDHKPWGQGLLGRD